MSVGGGLISGLDAAGINKLRGRGGGSTRSLTPLLTSYSLTHSVSQSLSSHSSNQLNSFTPNVPLELQFLPAAPVPLPESLSCKMLEIIHH